MAKDTKEARADDLASILKTALNSKLAKGSPKIAYGLGDDDNPSNVKEFISTGCDVLDLAISNRPNGGLPVGRISEITGLEQTGKSVFCASVITQTQKKGGMGIYIDTENAISEEFFQMLGVNTSSDKFVYASIRDIEDVFEAIDVIVTKAVENKNTKPLTICVDSIAATSTKVEMESDFDKDGYSTTKAIVIGKAMRKLTNSIARGNVTLIFTNQLRQILNAVAFGEQWSSPGGKAIPFHASVRIRLQNIAKVKAKLDGIETVVGNTIRATIVKNRIGPPNTKAEYDFYYASGFDNYGGWLTILKKYGIVRAGGAWYSYTDQDENEFKFQSKDFTEIVESNPKLKDELYKKICDKLIVIYEKSDIGIDDVTVTNENDEELTTPKPKKERKQLNDSIIPSTVVDNNNLVDTETGEILEELNSDNLPVNVKDALGY